MFLWRLAETSCLLIICFWRVNKCFKPEKESYLETSFYNFGHKSPVTQRVKTDSGHAITHCLLPERSGKDRHAPLYLCPEIIQGSEVTSLLACHHEGDKPTKKDLSLQERRMRTQN